MHDIHRAHGERRTSERVRQVWALWLVLLSCAGAVVINGQDEPLAVRLERIARIRADAAEAFFDTLRRHVGRDERREACAMLSYPLPHSSGVVNNAGDCESRYDAIFTLPVRKAIGSQRLQDLFVNEAGVMIGMGEVWFAGACAAAPCERPSDLHVMAITSPGSLVPPKGKVLLACFVSGQRVRVSADGQGGASLSVWRDSRRYMSAPPDLEFPRANPPGPASGCASRTWSFDDGTRTYTVSDLPCDAYLSPPPMGSVGRVTLSTREALGVPLWCVE
jgi:hypothetical protein